MLPGPNIYPKNWRGILALTALSLLLTASDVAFFIWRWDKPTGHPGGPLADMGGGVLFWEWTAWVSPMFIVPSVFRIVRGVRARLKPEATKDAGPA